MRHEHGTPEEGAALIKFWLEQHGAVFSLTADDEVRCDLNGVADIRTWEDADRVATMVMALRDEIRQILRAERTTH